MGCKQNKTLLRQFFWIFWRNTVSADYKFDRFKQYDNCKSKKKLLRNSAEVSVNTYCTWNLRGLSVKIADK